MLGFNEFGIIDTATKNIALQHHQRANQICSSKTVIMTYTTSMPRTDKFSKCKMMKKLQFFCVRQRNEGRRPNAIPR